jgi:hypothetical protein
MTDSSAPQRPRLPRRAPGEADLRIFTMAVIPAGRHREVPGRAQLRVVRETWAGGLALRPVVGRPG